MNGYEDFDKFADSLQEVVNFIRGKQPEQSSALEVENTEEQVEKVPEAVKDFLDITFEDI